MGEAVAATITRKAVPIKVKATVIRIISFDSPSSLPKSFGGIRCPGSIAGT
jgi:hypothetical protein